jgi:hypothetical protein
MFKLGHTFFGTRTRTENADILANVSRQRIEVNSASSERVSDKRFEIYRKFAENYFRDRFFKSGLR